MIRDMNIVKVKDHPHLVKDLDSKAVLNTNYAALLEYKRKKQMEEEVKSLKTDVSDMKDTLNKILSLLNK
jgi:tetrahydromethanopterin S-methyltransferase subunit B